MKVPEPRWMSAGTIVVFALALAGAGYAIYALVPSLLADPQLRRLGATLVVVFVAALAVIAIASKFRGKGGQ